MHQEAPQKWVPTKCHWGLLYLWGEPCNWQMSLSSRIEVCRVAWSSFYSSTRGGNKALNHVNKACKVHIILLSIHTILYPFNLGIIRHTHLGPCPLLSPILLSNLLSMSIHPSNNINLNLVNGATLHKDGGIRKPKLLPYCLLSTSTISTPQ